MSTHIPSNLSDKQLVAEVERLAHCERLATATLVAHLAEFDGRRLYLGLGFSSLFAYCTETLRLSEHEAFNRIEAARAARKFPIILDMLSAGSVNLTAVRLLAPHLTTENHEEVLGAASGKNKRAVEELVARLSPKPDVPFSIRKLPVPRQAPQTSSAVTNERPCASAEAPVAAPPPAPPNRQAVAPLSPGQYRVQFTAGAGTQGKLQFAKDLLRHAIPSGNEAEIFDRALDALLADLARNKFGATDRPRRSRRLSADPYYVPAWVKRVVWVRDFGRCRFVGSTGRCCNERSFTEFHHVIPPSGGGKATPENMQLRCRAHNGHEADVYYGPREPKDAPSVVREGAASYRAASPTRSGTTKWPAAVDAVGPTAIASRAAKANERLEAVP